MSLAMLVYMVAVIPKIGLWAGIILAVTVVLGGITFINARIELDIYGINEKDPHTIKAKAVCKFLLNKLWIPFVLVMVTIICPSKETLYTMIAAYGVEKVIENPVAQDLASDGVDVLKQLMSRAKKELTEDAPKESK